MFVNTATSKWTAAAEYICTCEGSYTWSGSECSDACLDEDDDNHGVGAGCMGPDCDDNDADVFDGNPETCDGKDNDCDERTDCAGGVCTGSDPCVDDNLCSEDSCDPNAAGCAHDSLAVPQDVDCDPDGDEDQFGLGDGVCTAEMTCLRNMCRSCNEDADCIDGHCICADESCSSKRCYNDVLVCQYLGGDETNCAPANTPAGRQGPGCDTASHGSDNWACDGDGACEMVLLLLFYSGWY